MDGNPTEQKEEGYTLDQLARLGNHCCVIVASGAFFIATGYWLTSEVAVGMGSLTIALVGGFVVFVGVGIGPIVFADIRDWLRVRGELN